MLGAPADVSHEGSGDRWTYAIGTARIVVDLVRDTVRAWDVTGQVTRALARRAPSWSGDQAASFPRRVTAYLDSNQVPITRAYAMYRACAVHGMSPGEVSTSWGVPLTDTLTIIGPGRRMRTFQYAAGLEGQRIAFSFVNDSLATFTFLSVEPE